MPVRFLLSALFAGVLSLPMSALGATGVYSEGHADISVRMNGNQLELGINMLGAIIDGNLFDGFVSFSDILLYVPDSTLEPRPANFPGVLDFDPIGIGEGEDMYRLPASGTEAITLGAPFFGFGTYLLNSADFVGSIVFQLVDVVSPPGGEFALYQDAFPGPTFYMTTADGISAADKLQLPAGAHDHFNFVFTKDGIYDLGFSVTATHRQFGQLTASGRLSAGVTTTVPEASSMLLASVAMVGAGFVAWRRQRSVAV